MKNVLIGFLLIILWSSAVYEAANAQFIWQVSHSDFDGKLYYTFDALSSSGNICIAGGKIIDVDKQSIIRAFWRSTDAGVTWKMQDPGFPPLHYLGYIHHDYFNSIQQIDSLNAVAIGDSGLMMRTFDGGISWERQDCKTTLRLTSVYFSDSLNGIVLGAGGGIWHLYKTIDGGRDWNLVPFFRDNLSSCYSAGEGKYRIFHVPRGPIYTTNDNWQSIDSSKPFPDTAADAKNYFFSNCNFSGGDTVIAFGQYSATLSNVDIVGALMRSTNGGNSWEKPVFPKSVWQIDYMTLLNRDTILAACRCANKILMSTNRGSSWRTDSLLLDTSYSAYSPRGVVFAADGSPIAAYSFQTSQGIPSILIHGKSSKSRVEWFGVVYYHQRIFPNPASTVLNIASVQSPKPFQIVDVIGRVMVSGMLPDRESLPVDVSSLPRGIYFVLVDGVVVGKAVLIGK